MAISISDEAGGNLDITVEAYGTVGEPGDTFPEAAIQEAHDHSAAFQKAFQDVQEGRVSPVDWSQIPDETPDQRESTIWPVNEDEVYAEPAEVGTPLGANSPEAEAQWRRREAIQLAASNPGHTGYMVILAAEAFVRYIETGSTEEAAKAFPFVTLDQIGEIERELELFAGNLMGKNQLTEEVKLEVRESLINIASILGMNLEVKQ